MWWELFFLCVAVGTISAYIGDRVAYYQTSKRLTAAHKDYIRNWNTLTMGLIETYCIRSKHPTKFQDAEALHHILRRHG